MTVNDQFILAQTFQEFLKRESIFVIQYNEEKEQSYINVNQALDETVQKWVP